MGGRVLATDEALRAAQAMRSRLKRLEDTARQAALLGQRLCDPSIWDCRDAVQFRQVTWPRASGDLVRSAHSFAAAAEHLDGVVQDIITAGASGRVTTGGLPAGPPPPPPDPKDAYLQQAYADAGIDPTSWDPGKGLKANDAVVREVYAYYQGLWDENHDLQWAGMAKLAGGSVYGGLQDLYVVSQLPRDELVKLAAQGNPLAQFALAVGTEEVTYFEDTFLKMQKDIFMDLAWQHAAYAHGGMAAIDDLRRQGLLTGDTYLAWQDINSGDPNKVAYGNMLLLRREQHDVIQGTYDQLRSRNWIEGRLFTDFLSENAQSPVPGGRPFKDVVGSHVDLAHIGPLTVGWETANVTNFGDRWKWITKDMLPRYEQLLQDPQRAQQYIDTPLSDRAKQYRDLPELHVDGY